MASRKLIAHIRVNPLAKSLVSLPPLPASLSTLQKYQKDVILCVEGTSMVVDGRELFRSEEKMTIAQDDLGNRHIMKGGLDN